VSMLVVNVGSSSVRLSLFRQAEAGLVCLMTAHYRESVGDGGALLSAFLASLEGEAGEIDCVVHRIVHGGALFSAPVVIDSSVEAAIEQLAPLAPLHNPTALSWVRLSRHLLGDKVVQVAVFDTAFYHNLPAVAATYALPQRLCQQHNIRRYGFHGIAHRAMLKGWQAIRPQLVEGGRVISVQLGSGCSVTAIDHGVAVDTSMGFSPLEGLVMATRSGDVDPALILYLQREVGLSVSEVERLLSERSGLLGLSGASSDMQRLLESQGAEAKLAIDLYCYRVRKYIGAYLAVLGGADAILFGGGVGEHSSHVRAVILRGLTDLGIDLDSTVNSEVVATEGCISSVGSSTEVWVMKVDEAREMAEVVIDGIDNYAV